MSDMTLLRRSVLSLASAMLLLVTGQAWSADPAPATPPAPSKESRAQMATIHERMAACLRSDKAFDVCRTEMQANCQTMMGSQGCPMMGGMGMHGPGMPRGTPPASDKP